MTDFYARLERQLIDAGRGRAAHGRLRRAMAARGRMLLVACAGVLAVAAAATLVPALLSSSEPRHSAAPAPLAARDIRVAVLNGTTTPGMARAVAERLGDRGVTIAAVAMASDQRLVHTVVEYRGGAAAQARRVADVLGVRRLAPLAGADAALAPTAAVVVLVGHDRCGRPLRCVASAPGLP